MQKVHHLSIFILTPVYKYNTYYIEAFVEDLESHDEGIERFKLINVMLPTSPFFATKVMPILEANITTITTLELQSCDLNSNDISNVSKFVKKNKLLGVLNLSWNNLFGNEENSSAKQLAKSMKKHPELSYVNLSNTGLGKNNEALKIILEGSKEINSLILDDNTFDKEGIALVTNMLKKKNTVAEFSLGSVGIGEGKKGKTKARMLRDTLEKNTSLEQICLARNDLGSDERVLSIVMSGIKESVSLSHIDLSGNKIKKMSSIKLIAKYLASNPALVELNLGYNKIPAKSASILIKALEENTTLEHLSLAGNNIANKNVPAIIDVLQNNTTLRSLDLKDNKIKSNTTGRDDLFKAICDTTSLDSIANNSNHTCCLTIAGCNYKGSNENELYKINALEDEGEKIRYKVVLALCSLNKDLYNCQSFEDVPLELMPKLLELIQLEIGYNGYGKEITKRTVKKSTINRLNNVYETIHQWPAFPSLFIRGPGKDCLTKTGKLKTKRGKRVAKVLDEDEAFPPPEGCRKKRRRWWMSSPEPVKPSRSSSRATNAVSYADVENSEDESDMY